VPVTAPDVERVFLIADLSGYTALTEVHGDVHAAQAVTRFGQIVQSALEPGARLVNRVGDEAFIVAADATTVVRTAVALRAATEGEPLFPTLRSGIHAGPAVEQDDSYFGSAVNLTARVAGHARGGQILCTERVKTLATGLAEIDYQALGLMHFKNVADPVAIFEILVGRHTSEHTAIDPVCRMQVRPTTAPARLPFGGTTYYFCTFDCARAFAERPEHYAAAAAS
jgi:adenylate cyclase